MKNKFTHIGILKGCDNRAHNCTRKVKLRETKLYWITEWKNKYKKTSGWRVGVDWPVYNLDLNSIVKMI